MSHKSVILLYGLPCSGKSMVLRAMTDREAIAIDSIITRIVDDPVIADFHRLADQIVEEMFQTLKCHHASQFIIEMGCLVPGDAITRLEQLMSEAGYRFTNIVLTADDSVLIDRIIQRNAAIDAGESDSIKVDGPDYLSRFKRIFGGNKPVSFAEIDTSHLSREQLLTAINSATDALTEA